MAGDPFRLKRRIQAVEIEICTIAALAARNAKHSPLDSTYARVLCPPIIHEPWWETFCEARPRAQTRRHTHRSTEDILWPLPPPKRPKTNHAKRALAARSSRQRMISEIMAVRVTIQLERLELQDYDRTGCVSTRELTTADGSRLSEKDDVPGLQPVVVLNRVSSTPRQTLNTSVLRCGHVEEPTVGAEESPPVVAKPFRPSIPTQASYSTVWLTIGGQRVKMAVETVSKLVSMNPTVRLVDLMCGK